MYFNIILAIHTIYVALFRRQNAYYYHYTRINIYGFMREFNFFKYNDKTRLFFNELLESLIKLKMYAIIRSTNSNIFFNLNVIAKLQTKKSFQIKITHILLTFNPGYDDVMYRINCTTDTLDIDDRLSWMIWGYFMYVHKE